VIKRVLMQQVCFIEHEERVKALLSELLDMSGRRRRRLQRLRSVSGPGRGRVDDRSRADRGLRCGSRSGENARAASRGEEREQAGCPHRARR
jgi:hypothetical protein